MIVALKRYEIPCDGQPHTFPLCYPPVYAMNGTMKDTLWFFAEETGEVTHMNMTMMVVSDDEEWPDGALQHCVAPKLQAGHVWVLIQLPGPDPDWTDEEAVTMQQERTQLPDPFGSGAW